MQEVGWPDPAAVVAIIERTLNRRAFSLMVSMVEVDGPATEVTLMRSLLSDVRCNLTAFECLRRTLSRGHLIPPFTEMLKEFRKGRKKIFGRGTMPNRCIMTG